ncbi:MAG: hypothetical protein JSR85_08950 [Proteobacteria bacterium]|nr:hypothetical protein [Pseudomonadota bacterium]
MRLFTLIALGCFFLSQETVMATTKPCHTDNPNACAKDETCTNPLAGKHVTETFCFKNCTNDTDCKEKKHHFCSPNGNVCRDHCAQDSDCPSGLSCQKNKCEAAPAK